MKRTLLALLAFAFAAFSVSASVVLSDNFNAYTNGPIVGNSGLSPWANHSGITPMVVENGQLKINASQAEDVNALLVGQPYTTNSEAQLYARFTVMFTNTPSVAGAYFAHFKDTGTGFRCRIWASATNVATGATADPGTFFLGVGNSSGVNTANQGQLPDVLTTNVTYTVVARLVVSNAASSIWINPSSESDPSASGNDTLVAGTDVNIVAFAFRQSSGEGVIYVDDLKVGTAFNDVAGANTAPTISSIPNQAIPAGGSAGPVPFIVGDAETPPGNLTVTAISSNPALVPEGNPNIVLSTGDGTNRSITVTPLAGQQGSATITVNVSDGANTSFATFQITVGAPAISPIPNQTVLINETLASVPFTISDTESNASTLVVTATSSNPNLVPNAPANLTLNGSDSSQTLTITPLPNTNGVTTITVSVSDGFNTTSTSFVLTVRPVFGLVFSDDFSYTGFLLESALLGATPDSPWQHHSPTAAGFYELQVAEGQAELSGGLTEDVNASLTNAPFFPSDGWVLYTSFKLTYVDLPSTSSEYFLHLRDNGSGFRACVVATTNGVTVGKYRLGIANQSAASSAKVLYPQDLEPNTPCTVVTRYNVASGASTLWINPSSESSASVTATDPPSTQSISTIALRQSGGIGTNRIDNLKVGTSFSDVITVTTPLPEPLRIRVLGGSAILSWDNAAFSLQSATEVTGAFTTIAGATSPYTNSLSGGPMFFRLKY